MREHCGTNTHNNWAKRANSTWKSQVPFEIKDCIGSREGKTMTATRAEYTTAPCSRGTRTFDREALSTFHCTYIVCLTYYVGSLEALTNAILSQKYRLQYRLKTFKSINTAGFEPGTQQYIVLAVRRRIGPGPRTEWTTQNCTHGVTSCKCSPRFLSTCTRWRLDDVLNIPPPPVRLLLWSLRYSVGAIIVH